MNGQQLIDDLRTLYLDDVVLPYLWKDYELLRGLNLAERQAARRALLIEDKSTVADDLGNALTSVTIVPNVVTYTLSPLILAINRVKLASMPYPLSPKTRDDLDSSLISWEGAAGTAGTAGTAGGDPLVWPFCYIDEVGNELTFVRPPTMPDVASLIINRLPLRDFTLKTSPEIAIVHHAGLLHWAAHLAFMKPEADTMNLNLAAYHEKKFTEMFGPMPDAYQEKMRHDLPRRQRMRARPFGS